MKRRSLIQAVAYGLLGADQKPKDNRQTLPQEVR
jgi:hypothetical protein